MLIINPQKFSKREFNFIISCKGHENVLDLEGDSFQRELLITLRVNAPEWKGSVNSEY